MEAKAATDFLLKSMVNEMLCIMKKTEMQDRLKIVGKMAGKGP